MSTKPKQSQGNPAKIKVSRVKRTQKKSGISKRREKRDDTSSEEEQQQSSVSEDEPSDNDEMSDDETLLGKRHWDRSKKRMDPEELKKTCQSLLDANKGILRSIIYADPCMRYIDDESNRAGSASSHYNTMSLSDLKKLPVNEISAKNSVCLLWSFGPLLEQSMDLLRAWGFQYLTMFEVWVKTTNGRVCGPRQGYYTKQTCEYLLLGKKPGGTPHKLTKNGSKHYNVHLEDSTEHSRKPETFRKIIDDVFWNVPKIELFARISTDPNWDYWGNETKKFNGSTEDTSEELITQIRAMQLETVEKISKSKLKKGHLIDPKNRYGADINNQTTIRCFFKPVKKEEEEEEDREPILIEKEEEEEDDNVVENPAKINKQED